MILVHALFFAVFAVMLLRNLATGRAAADLSGAVCFTRREQPVRYWLMIAAGVGLVAMLAGLLAYDLTAPPRVWPRP